MLGLIFAVGLLIVGGAVSVGVHHLMTESGPVPTAVGAVAALGGLVAGAAGRARYLQRRRGQW